MEHIKISEGEYRLACIVWDNEPLPSGRLVELAADKLGWKKSTTYTVLKKLVSRGVLKNENATVSALIPRADILREESRDVVERTFGGSLPSFLTSFMSGRTLSAAEAEELKALIDRFREGGAGDD